MSWTLILKQKPTREYTQS